MMATKQYGILAVRSKECVLGPPRALVKYNDGDIMIFETLEEAEETAETYNEKTGSAKDHYHYKALEI